MYFEWSDFQNSSLNLGTNLDPKPASTHNGTGHESEEPSDTLVSSHTHSHVNEQTSSLQSLSIGEIMEAPGSTDQLGVSAVLHYCKSKILRPYMGLLATMGLRPFTLDNPDPNTFVLVLGYCYTLLVLVLMLLGYMLQYMACFRRDRGFRYVGTPKLMSSYNVEVQIYRQTCYGSIGFSYTIPSFLHLVAYLYALYLFRISNNEQLQSMMERVFLLSSGPYDGSSCQRRLLKTLWIFIACSIVWMLLSLLSVNFMMAESIIIFQWIHSSSSKLSILLKVLMMLCTLLHDMVQATVITSYCLQAQLLKSHLYFLRAKLMQQYLTPLDWMREISEFRKLINYLNDGLAPAVCLFTIVNLAWACSGVLWLLKLDSTDLDTDPIFGISVLNVCLWLLIALAPFIQAARLTSSCVMMQGVGHDIRTRPIAYHSTPGTELDSILLYASSLRMNAKLFKVPITGRCLFLSITIISVLMLTLDIVYFYHKFVAIIRNF